MHELEDIKNEQIKNILLTVKLAALLFSGIIGFKYISADKRISNILENIPEGNILIGGVCVAIIYLIWLAITYRSLKTDDKSNKSIIEYIVFMSFFLLLILISGGHESPHKYLFLFIITTSTIQTGIKGGLSIGMVSASIILILDLVALPGVRVNPYFEDDLVLAGIFILTAYSLGSYVKFETEHINELKHRVNIDGLTGLYNHRYFYDVLNYKLKKINEDQGHLSLLFLDIDYFKYYNDLNGHQKGDIVLQKLGEILTKEVGSKGIVARYGGEEFAVLLPYIDKEEGIKIAEQIRRSVQDTYFEAQENQPQGNITVSVGLATYPENAKDDTTLIKSADDALYRAKFFSKNRVEVYASVLDEIKKDINESETELVTSIKTLISVINAKDRYTYAHTERVVMFSRMMAEALGLSERDRKSLVYGAYMHDIGKINIPVEVLNKKMPLTDEEWECLKQHSQHGVEIIRNVESLKEIIPLIRHHHEKYNGTGYPLGLKGEEIPYIVRILTIIDSFDAMTSNRPYNIPKTYEEAFEELRRCRGTQFDPELVEVFIKTINENKDKIK